MATNPNPDFQPIAHPGPIGKLLADIRNRFTYHAPKNDQVERYAALRDRFRELAEYIASHTPASREQSTALTHLDIAMMQANAAIARNE
jgi:hypothetical protein